MCVCVGVRNYVCICTCVSLCVHLFLVSECIANGFSCVPWMFFFARNRSQPLATVHNHPQPSATICDEGFMAVPLAIAAKADPFRGLETCATSFTWQAWLKSVAEPRLSKQEVNQHAHLKSPTRLPMVLICLDALVIRCCYCSTFHEKQHVNMFMIFSQHLFPRRVS